MVNTIFFDLDDTLLDFRRSEANALRQALLEAGLPAGEAVLARYHAINRRQWELLEEGALTREQVMSTRFDILFAELGVTASGAATSNCYEALLAEEHGVLPGAKALLEELAPRCRLFAASNGSSAVQRRRLEGSGLRPYFRDVFISEEMGADKPNPRFFHRCFASIPEFSPAASLIVGDSLTSDIRGGLNAGLRTCWFNPAGAPARPDICPDHIITDLTQLPPLLERL